MAPLAAWCKASGLDISGSDSGKKTHEDLARLEVKVFKTHDSEHMKNVRTAVYSSAIDKSNTELSFARSQGLRILHRSELLKVMLDSSRSITVAGTHGKTTTTSLIGHVLTALGCDPSIISGATIRSLGSSFRKGSGDLFVAEADESDGSFIQYKPWLGVITNIDLDHLDFYRDEAGLNEGFRSYLNGIQKDGFAVLGWDCPRTRELGQVLHVEKLTYGTRLGCDVRALDIYPDQGTIRFSAVVERDLVDCRLLIPGRHNVQNALCAMAVGRCLGLPAQAVADAISTFEGVQRRLEFIYDSSSYKIIDDYAHNPGKIAAAVQSVAEAWPHLPVRVVFQPHRFSRVTSLYYEFANAFKEATEVIVTPVFAAGEAVDESFATESLAQEIARTSKVSAIAKSSLGDTIKYLSDTRNRAQVVMTVGAGDVNKIATTLKELFLAEEGKNIVELAKAQKTQLSKESLE